jgi:threonyl-tRNA synthetase
MIHITLPDGSKREFPGPVTVADVAASIGTGLAKAALGGKIGDKLVDTSHTINLTARWPSSRPRTPDGLELIRHSTAHTCWPMRSRSCFRMRRSRSAL